MWTGDGTSRDQPRGSCAPATQPHAVNDVTDGVSASEKAIPARCRRVSGEPCDHDDDVTTTTSGSYTMDRAQELCSEIDQMFFTPDSTNVWHNYVVTKVHIIYLLFRDNTVFVILLLIG